MRRITEMHDAIVSVTMVMVYVLEERNIYIDGRRKAKFI